MTILDQLMNGKFLHFRFSVCLKGQWGFKMRYVPIIKTFQKATSSHQSKMHALTYSAIRQRLICDTKDL